LTSDLAFVCYVSGMMARVDTPLRQVRACYTDTTITVYQAYSAEIAGPAVAAGRFVAPFKRERMTWISDVTDFAQKIHGRLTSGDDAGARALLPVERPYPLPAEIGTVVGATPASGESAALGG
jgi:hypothetical protein